MKNKPRCVVLRYTYLIKPCMVGLMIYLFSTKTKPMLLMNYEFYPSLARLS